MRVEDLMVGDWVLIHEPVCKGHRIDYISEMDEEVGADGELYSFDDVRPIPITLEFLVKNNLEKIMTDYYDLDVYEENDGLWRVVYTNLECSGFDESVVVSSVHELQHFLRHLKIDIDMKEIEL